VVSEETVALQDKVAKLSGDLAALKAGLDNANRTAATQLNRIGERLDRAEKAQAEPAAKLAKIMDTLDRLERRTAAAPAPEHTGSVTSIEKQQSKPAEVEGWRLRDFYAGRAILENRAGALYEVGPGSNLPGVGKVETIKRVDGKIVITTPKGIITSALEPPRHPPYFLQRY
jgi:seryl-tRNA synthetase